MNWCFICDWLVRDQLIPDIYLCIYVLYLPVANFSETVNWYVIPNSFIVHSDNLGTDFHYQTTTQQFFPSYVIQVI